VHDEKDKTKANLISRFFDTRFNGNHFPRPFGVIFAEERPTYDDILNQQMETLYIRKGKLPLNRILSGNKTWTIL
jgi:2-oxoglutarate ferredoxin oxidoreductase subunit beta